MTLVWIMISAALFFISFELKFEVIETKCDLRRPRVPPSKPFNLTVLETQYEQALIGWAEPAHGSRPIQLYLIAIRNETTRWKIYGLVPYQTQLLVLRNLTANHTYQVRVRAVSAHGFSDPSRPLDVLTATPPGPRALLPWMKDFVWDATKGTFNIVKKTTELSIAGAKKAASITGSVVGFGARTALKGAKMGVNTALGSANIAKDAVFGSVDEAMASGRLSADVAGKAIRTLTSLPSAVG